MRTGNLGGGYNPVGWRGRDGNYTRKKGGLFGKPGYRDRLTLICNSLFEYDAQGKARMTVAAPIFQEVRERQESAWLKEFHEGVCFFVA